MKVILVFLVLFVLSVTACETNCGMANISFRLVGFSESEADTIIMRKFQKNSSFSKLLDTVLLDNIRYESSNDTLHVTAISGSSTLFSNYDYEILLSGASKLFTITGITERQETATNFFNCGKKDQCINPLTGYTVNGQFSSAGPDGFLMYLKK